MGTGKGAFFHGVKKTGCVIAGLYVGTTAGGVRAVIGGIAGVLCGGIASN